MTDFQPQSNFNGSSYSYSSSGYWCLHCKKPFTHLRVEESTPSQVQCPRCGLFSSQLLEAPNPVSSQMQQEPASTITTNNTGSSYAYGSSRYYCNRCRRQFSQLNVDNSPQAECPRCGTISSQIINNAQSTGSSGQTQAQPSNGFSGPQPNSQSESFIYVTQPIVDPFGNLYFQTIRIPVRPQSQAGEGNILGNSQSGNNNNINAGGFTHLFNNVFLSPFVFGVVPDEAIIEQFLRNDPNRYGPPPASEEALNKLGEFKFDKETYGGIVEHPFCSVCQEEYQQDDCLVRLPCNHDYHKECVTAWLTKHNSCPLCRKAI